MRDALSHSYSLRHKARNKFSAAGARTPPLPSTPHTQPAASEDTAVKSENQSEYARPTRKGDAISGFRVVRNIEIEIFLLNCSTSQYSHSRIVTFCKFRE